MPSAHAPAQVANVLRLLDNVKQIGDGWMASCPAHADRRPSLSVNWRDGHVLLHCFAGCDTADVLKELGLAWTDLTTNPHDGERRATARYNYVNADGVLLDQKLRYTPKGFSWRRKNGKGEWEHTHGSRWVLYRLPQVLEAVRNGRTVFVVEGEKDVRAVEKLGLVATTNPEGSGRWRPEYSEALRGAKVVILPDNDEAGRQHGQAVAQSLQPLASRVRLVNLPNLPQKGDVSDWLEAGGARKALRTLVRATPVWTPTAGSSSHTSLSHFQLLTADELEHLPPIEFRVEGLVPAGALVEVHGAPGSAKTFVAIDLVLSVATGLRWAGHAVKAGPTVYVIGEGRAGLGARIRAWRSYHKVEGELKAHFLTEPVNLLDESDVTAFIDALRGLPAPPALIAIDTLARCFVGGDENSAQDMGRAIAALDRIRAATGAAILVVHHVQKNGSEERGSSALRGALDVMMSIHNAEGRLTVRCLKAKDFSPFDPVVVGLIPHEESCVVGPIEIAEMLRADELPLAQRTALQALGAQFPDGARATEWSEAAELPQRTFYDARASLLRRGLVERESTGRRSRYRVTSEGATVIAESCTCTASELQPQPADSLRAAAPSLEGRHRSDGTHASSTSDNHTNGGRPDVEQEAESRPRAERASSSSRQRGQRRGQVRSHDIRAVVPRGAGRGVLGPRPKAGSGLRGDGPEGGTPGAGPTP